MGHARMPKHKHHRRTPQEHERAHQEDIHRATISQLLKPVADPDHPGQLIPLCELEQRERARFYRISAAGTAQSVAPATKSLTTKSPTARPTYPG